MTDAIQWDRDDRRASFLTRFYIRGMWWARDKAAFADPDQTLQTARKRQQAGNRSPTCLTRLRTSVSTIDVAEMPTWVVRPRGTAPVAARVIYLHGGGYVHPLTVDYWRLVRALTTVPAEVVVPAYPLAPAFTIDEVLPLLARLERETDKGLPTIMMGDSAGGALAVVLAQYLRDSVRAAPAGIVALCPWLDAVLGDDQVGRFESSDPMLAAPGLRAAARWWAGARSPSDPLVSPLTGSLLDLPPLDVYIGDHDILRPAVDDLADRAAEISLHIHEVPAMFHVWMTRCIPEGRRTRRELVRLLRRRVQS